MDKLTKGIQNKVPWCILFAHNIILIDETKDDLNNKLEQWRHTLEFKEFRLSRSKTEYLKCRFNSEEAGGEGVTTDGVAILRPEKLRYLGSIMEEKGDIDEDISLEWQKWKKAPNTLCDKKIPVGLKRRIYHMVSRPALLYDSEC